MEDALTKVHESTFESGSLQESITNVVNDQLAAKIKQLEIKMAMDRKKSKKKDKEAGSGVGVAIDPNMLDEIFNIMSTNIYDLVPGYEEV